VRCRPRLVGLDLCGAVVARLVEAAGQLAAVVLDPLTRSRRSLNLGGAGLRHARWWSRAAGAAAPVAKRQGAACPERRAAARRAALKTYGKFSPRQHRRRIVRRRRSPVGVEHKQSQCGQFCCQVFGTVPQWTFDQGELPPNE